MGVSLKPSPSDHAVQETFILKLEPKLEQQPVRGQRGSLVKQLRLEAFTAWVSVRGPLPSPCGRS